MVQLLRQDCLLCREVFWNWTSEGVRESLVERDSKVVVDWVMGTLCPWIFLDKVERIRHSISHFDFQIAWVPCSANSAADVLARQGLSLDTENVDSVM